LKLVEQDHSIAVVQGCSYPGVFAQKLDRPHEQIMKLQLTRAAARVCLGKNRIGQF
jgi:hypothetical protein